MAHKLTEDELTRIRDAFTEWDITGEGTIRARDMGKVLELLGERPSRDLQTLLDRPDAEDERVNFDEFLIMTVGPPWEANGYDAEEELKEAIAEFDDGDGYVPLRDLMRILHEHMEESGYYPTDGELVDVYRQVLDGSLFATAGAKLSAGSMWKVFEEEFAKQRKGKQTENVASAIAGGRKYRALFARLRFAPIGPVNCFRRLCSQLGWRKVDSVAVRDGAGDNGVSAGQMTSMINFTVVDLGGEPLMSDAVASTWSVQALQQHIETVVGVPVHRQCLLLAGDEDFRQELCPSKASLSNAGLVDGSTVLLAVKDEVKLDYKKFVSRFMEVDFEHAATCAQTQGRRV